MSAVPEGEKNREKVDKEEGESKGVSELLCVSVTLAFVLL